MASADFLKTLAAYVPSPVAQSIYRRPRVLTEPITHHFPAVVLYTDISGFTRLSELLGQAGPTGAEELTQLINRYFTQMIQTIEAYHGQVVKFSGDALTVIFPAVVAAQAGTGSMQMAVRQAGECALAMQSKMSRFAKIQTSRGEASLSMKVGIGAGAILACHVGGILGRWEYLVGGDPVTQVAMAEHYAQPGQVILSPQAWTLAQEFFQGTASAPDPKFFNLSTVITSLPPIEPITLDWSQLDPEQRQAAEKALQCYVPGAIKARLNEQADWLAELRRMTILFVGIGGIDYEAPNADRQIQNFLQATQEIIYRFEGSLGKVAVDDKGTVLLLLFGAPPFSHEDDAARAVACALNLQTVGREQGLRVAIGITEGSIFAGPVGAPSRREYTVIGDEVNLAARLMQYGRAGTIVISDRVKERAGPRFVMESLGRISLKGKAETVVAHLVTGEQGLQEEFELRYLLHDDPLIGRAAELKQIRKIAERARTGNLQLLFIEGELGLGKSRLVAEIVREWMMSGAEGYGSKYISYGRHTPYHAWREVLNAMYGFTPNLSPQRQLARLAGDIAKLDDPPDQPGYWADRLPLLADVLGLDIPANKFTQNISGQLRRDNTFVLIEALLRRQAQRRPLMIVLEDIHWADELSLSLVRHLAKTLIDTPCMFVLVYRPMSETGGETLADLEALPHTHTITLNPFSPQESLKLIKNLMGDRKLPGEARETLLSWSQGNPFFLQEIARSILELAPEDQADDKLVLIKTVDLPDTVHDVILTRIDRLSEAEKLTLKVASVIGTSFQRSLLSEIHPMEEARSRLSSHLEHLENAKLLQLAAPAPRWEYVFRNVLTQEVVYEGLLLAQRRQLHVAVGVALENLVPDEVERLAFHYSHGGDLEKALSYMQRAAEKARREYANEAAINYYTEILSLLMERDTGQSQGAMMSPEYWDTLLERARVYSLIGRPDEAREDLGALGILAEALNDDRRRAQAAKEWAHFYESGGDYDSGLEMIERFMQLAQQTGDETLIGDGYNQWGKLLYIRREYETAEQYLQQALSLAQKHHDDGAQADCFNSLGIVAHYQANNDPGYFDVALYFLREAKDLWHKMGEQVGLANSLSNLGQVYYNMGQFISAQQHYQKALALRRTIGDRTGEASARLGLGQVHRSLGNYDAARRFLEKALATYQTIGDRRSETYSLFHLGFLHCRIEEYDIALTYLDEALLTLRQTQEIGGQLISEASILWDVLSTLGELDDLVALGKALSYYGWTLLGMGRPRDAKPYFEEAMRIKRETRQRAAAVEDVAHLGLVALELNQLELAATYARHVLDFIQNHNTQGIEHLATVYLTCYRILQANQKTEQAAQVLAQGQQYVASQAEQIDDPVMRQNYLTGIPENQALAELAGQPIDS
jgi:class 3 adenylate cyclase/tetratricopeptide (TPR) repeat protein